MRLVFAALAVLSSVSQASVNHRPTISWIADQRSATAGATVGPLSFTIGDAETPAASLTVTAASSNTTLLPNASITLGGSGASRTVTLAPASGQFGLTTITLTVTDGSGATAAASFTLTVAATINGNTAPLIQSVANTVLPTGTAYGPVALVVEDAETAAASLTLSATSSNTTLVPSANIVFGGAAYGRNVKVTPASGQTGRAVITLSVQDGTITPFNTTSTSFVVDVVASNTPPTLTPPSNQVIPLGTASVAASFTIGDAETAATDLLVNATSSNTNLLPNANIAISGSGANQTITLTPVPGVTGAAKVTISVTDTDITTSKTFLLIVFDPAAASSQLARPRGVYVLSNPGAGTSYTTTFGKAIKLGDGNIQNLPFVDGYVLRVPWNNMESDTTPGAYDFFIIANAINKLPAGQKLSIIIQPAEPAYIATTSGVTTWTDTSSSPSVTRAVPWDPYIQQQFNALVQAMAAYTVNGTPLGQHPAISVLDAFMPGGYTGFRDPQNILLKNMPGYSAGTGHERDNILNAGRNALIALQTNFPGKFVQFGFWMFTDGFNSSYNNLTAWEYVRETILNEFNGMTRPRVGFFMENLAAKRAGPAIDPYTPSPPTSYSAPMNLSQSSAWTAYQMLGNWTSPFQNAHVLNTLNGTPADAMEFAFTYEGTEYFEIYISDITNTAMQPDLTLWHQFFQTAVTTDTPPTLDAIGSQATTGGAVSVTLTVGDSQSSASALTVSASSSNTALAPQSSFAFSGSGATRTLTVTPAAGQAGVATISVTVTDQGGLTTTKTFTLTVLPQPVPPTTSIVSGGVQLNWPTTAGIHYQVQYSPDLVTWTFIGSPALASGTTMSWTDDGTQTGSAPLSQTRRFYRVVISP